MNDIFCLFHHLRFCNPQCSLGNCNSKIINLNSIKLINRNMNRGRFIKAKVICPLCNSFMTSFSNRRILIYVSVRKFPLPDAGSSHRRFANFVWKSLSFYLLFSERLSAEFLSAYFQFVQKQRINDFMNIFNAGVVHTAGASCLWIQRTLKHSTKYSRTDF